MKVNKVLKQIFGEYYTIILPLFNDINNRYGILDIYIITEDRKSAINEQMFSAGNISYKYAYVQDVFPSDSIDKYVNYLYIIYNSDTKLFLNNQLMYSDNIYMHKPQIIENF